MTDMKLPETTWLRIVSRRPRGVLYRYVNRQWRYNRRIVCIHGRCNRMIGAGHGVYCNTHAARCE